MASVLSLCASAIRITCNLQTNLFEQTLNHFSRLCAISSPYSCCAFMHSRTCCCTQDRVVACIQLSKLCITVFKVDRQSRNMQVLRNFSPAIQGHRMGPYWYSMRISNGKMGNLCKLNLALLLYFQFSGMSDHFESLRFHLCLIGSRVIPNATA